MRKHKLNNMIRIIKFLIGTSLFLTIWAKDDAAVDDFKADNAESAANFINLEQKSSITFPARISLRKLMEEERSLEIRKLLDMDRNGFIDNDIKSLLDLLSTEDLVDYHLDYEIKKENIDDVKKEITDKTLNYYDDLEEYRFDYDVGNNEDPSTFGNTKLRDSDLVEKTSERSAVDEQTNLNYYDYEEEFRKSDTLDENPKIGLNTNDQVDIDPSIDIQKVKELQTSITDSKLEEVEENPHPFGNKSPTKKSNSSCQLCQVLQTPLLTAFNVSLEDAFNNSPEQIKQEIKTNTDFVESHINNKEVDESVNIKSTEEKEKNYQLLTQQNQRKPKDAEPKRNLEVISIPTLISSSDFSDNFFDEETTQSSGEAWQAWRGTQLHQHLLIKNEREEIIPDQLENISRESSRSFNNDNIKFQDTFVRQKDDSSIKDEDTIEEGDTIEEEDSTQRSSWEMWEAWRGQELHNQLLKKSDSKKSSIGHRNLDNLEITVVTNQEKEEKISGEETKLDCLTSFDKCLILNSNSRRPSVQNKEDTKNSISTTEYNSGIEGSGLDNDLSEIIDEKETVREEQSVENDDHHNTKGKVPVEDNILVIHSDENNLKKITTEKIFIVSPKILENHNAVNAVNAVNDVIENSGITSVTETPQHIASSTQSIIVDTMEKVPILSIDKDGTHEEETSSVERIFTENKTKLVRNNITQIETLNATNVRPINGFNATYESDVKEITEKTDVIASDIPTNLLKEITKITGGNFIKIENEDITQSMSKELLESTTEEAFKFKTKKFNFDFSEEISDYDNSENIIEPKDHSSSIQTKPQSEEPNQIIKPSSTSVTKLKDDKNSLVDNQQSAILSQSFMSAVLSPNFFENNFKSDNNGKNLAQDSLESNLERNSNVILNSKEEDVPNDITTKVKQNIPNKSDVDIATKFLKESSKEPNPTTTKEPAVTEKLSNTKIKTSVSEEIIEIPVNVELSHSLDLQANSDESDNTMEDISDNPSADNTDQISKNTLGTSKSSDTKISTDLESRTSENEISLKPITVKEMQDISNLSPSQNSDENQLNHRKMEEEPRSQVTSEGKEPEWLENIQETAVPLLANWIVDYIKKDDSLSAKTDDITQNLVNQAIIENLPQISPNFDASNISGEKTPQITIITGNLATNLAEAIANNSNTVLFLYDDESSEDGSFNNAFGDNFEFTHPEIIIPEEAITNTRFEATTSILDIKGEDNDSNEVDSDVRTETVNHIKRPVVTLPPKRLLSTLRSTEMPPLEQNDIINEIGEEISDDNLGSTRLPFTRSPFRTKVPITLPTVRATKTPKKSDNKIGTTQTFDINTEVTLDPELYEVQEIPERGNILLDSINDISINRHRGEHLTTRKPQEQSRVSNDNSKRNKEILEILNNIRKFNKNRNKDISSIKPKDTQDDTITPFERPEITIPPLKRHFDGDNDIHDVQEDDIKNKKKTTTGKPNTKPEVTHPPNRILSTSKPSSSPIIEQNDSNSEINLESVNQIPTSSVKIPTTRPTLRSTRAPFTRPTTRSTTRPFTRPPFTRPPRRPTRTPFTRPPLRTTKNPFTRPPLKTRPPFTRPPIRQNPSTEEPFTIIPIRQNNTKKSIQENRKRNRLNNGINDRKTTKALPNKSCGCKNHGDCLEDDTCFCSHGYTGPRCETSLRKGVVIGGLKNHTLRADTELVGGISRRCTIPDYPLEFMAATAQTFNQTIVVCGGAIAQAGKGLAATPICHSWTVSTPLFTRTFGQAQWSGEFNLTIPRAWAASVRIPHDYMMILGGVDHENNTLDTIEVVNVGTKTSIPLGLKMPSPLAGHCAVQLNSTHTLVTGGATEGYVGFSGTPSLTAKTWILSEKGWEELEPLSVARTSHSCSTYITSSGDPEVLVTGGVGVSDVGTRTLLNSVEIFSVVKGKWRKGPSLPLPQIGAGLVEMAGRPLLFGGRWQVGSKLRQAESVIHFQVGTNPLPWNPAQFKLKSPRDMGVTITAPSFC